MHEKPFFPGYYSHPDFDLEANNLKIERNLLEKRIKLLRRNEIRHYRDKHESRLFRGIALAMESFQLARTATVDVYQSIKGLVKLWLNT